MPIVVTKHTTTTLPLTVVTLSLMALLASPSAAQNITTFASTTTLAPPVTLAAAPIALGSIFYVDADSADNARYMAMVTNIVSTICGFAPNGVLASRSALLLTQCVEATPNVNTPMQLPFVTALGGSGPWAYYYGAAVMNPSLFLGLGVCTGGLGLLIASSRGITRRRGLSMVHYPAHLLLPFSFIMPQSVYSAAVVITRESDPLFLGLTWTFVLAWPALIAIMAVLLFKRFRAVYVRRMETIDESGNVTTVRRKIREDREEIADLATLADGGASDLGSKSWFDAGSAREDGSSENMSANNRSSSGMLGQLALSFSFLKLPGWEAREAEAKAAADARAEAEKKKAQEVLAVTDAVLRSMFTQAQKVGTDRLVLMYAVQGHYEWIDDDEIDTEELRRQCDASGRDYHEAMMLEEERAEAARGYVQRFGSYFGFYRRKFRFSLLMELFLNGLTALCVGLWISDDGFTNCYIQSSCLFVLFATHLVLVMYTRPQIGRLNNIFCNGLSAVQTLAIGLNGISAITESPGPSQAATVFAVLLTYAGALRALLDVYVYVTQRMYEAGVQWPAIAELTDIHIKAHQALRAKSAAEATPAAPVGPGVDSGSEGGSKKGRKRAASRNRNRSVSVVTKATIDPDGDHNPATAGLIPLHLDGVVRHVDPDEFASNPAVAARWRQVTEARRNGAVSRVMPLELLPFSMVPLRERPFAVPRSKSERFERRRKELAAKVRWASTLQSVRVDKKFLEDSSSSDEDIFNGLGTDGTSNADGVDKASVLSENHVVRRNRAGTVTDTALNKLLKLSDKEEQKKKRMLAQRAQLSDGRSSDGDVRELDEIRSSGSENRSARRSSNAGPLSSATSFVGGSKTSAAPAAATHHSGATSSSATAALKVPLLGGDLDGWSDDDLAPAPPVSSSAPPPPPIEIPPTPASVGRPQIPLTPAPSAASLLTPNQRPARRVEFKDI